MKMKENEEEEKKMAESLNSLNPWCQLQSDVLLSITDHITHFSDLIQFSRVCKSWRSFSTPILKHRLESLILWHPLSLSLFFFPTDGKLHKLNLSVDLKAGEIGGYFNGWLVVVHSFSTSLQLLHLFSGKIIDLLPLRPPQKPKYDLLTRSSGNWWYSLHWNEMVKVVVSSDAAVIMAITKVKRDRWILVFCEPRNDLVWSTIGFDSEGNENRDIREVTYYKKKGKFYGLDSKDGVVVVVEGVDDGPCIPFTRTISARSECVSGAEQCYLVECLGELLLVSRFSEEFKVEKLENDQWIVVKNLGDYALLICMNQSRSVSTVEYPFCRRNCIYFVCVDEDGRREEGMFNLEKCRRETLCFESGSHHLEQGLL